MKAGRGSGGAGALLCVVLWTASLMVPGSGDAAEGWVFIDADGDGVRAGGEEGLAGVAVSNGEAVVLTDVAGRYRLPPRDGFVFVTRPDGTRCEIWYREGSGDFALTPVPSSDEFFFIQVSDAHVYDRRSDFAEFSSRPAPWYIPQLVIDWITLRVLRERYGGDDPDAVMQSFRAALAPYRDAGELAELGDRALFRAYSDEFAREGSELGRVDEAARSAFREVAALDPSFVISSGDLVLESNQGSAEAVERWFQFYREITAIDGLEVYNLIGNNEIAGIQNPEFPPDDPRYGKHLFRRFHGPTHYSFDRGAFHFVALDTHRPDPKPGEAERWSFGDMEDRIRRWAEADLRLHAARIPVVLNHEPFHNDPAWGFEEDESASDGGLLEGFRVPYALSGHVHLNSVMSIGPTTHITTGSISGMRWVLPEDLHERGYRLFYARGRRLYSAWKRTGRPVIRRAEPPSAVDGAEPGERVIAVVDRSGAFESIRATRGGEPVRFERWGDYFIRVQLDATAVAAGPAPLEIVASRRDGSVYRALVTLAP